MRSFVPGCLSCLAPRKQQKSWELGRVPWYLSTTCAYVSAIQARYPLELPHFMNSNMSSNQLCWGNLTCPLKQLRIGCILIANLSITTTSNLKSESLLLYISYVSVNQPSFGRRVDLLYKPEMGEAVCKRLGIQMINATRQVVTCTHRLTQNQMVYFLPLKPLDSIPYQGYKE